MPHRITYSEDKRVAIVLHNGEVSIGEVDEVATSLEGEAEQSGNLNALIDLRDASKLPTRADYLLWLRGRGLPSTRITKVALLADPRDAETVEFQALASKNRGMTIESFSNIAEAMSWLRN